jgi:hypothetical protein
MPRTAVDECAVESVLARAAVDPVTAIDSVITGAPIDHAAHACVCRAFEANADRIVGAETLRRVATFEAESVTDWVG